MKITDKHGQQWQLVPVEPTESIERAYYWQQEKSGFRNCYPVYQSLLSAAPEPELPEGLEPVAWLHETRKQSDVITDAVKTLLSEEKVRFGFDSSVQRSGTDKSEHYTIPLVLQSAALAELAKKDVEIAAHEFSWAGCSQQLKDACEDLEAAEASNKAVGAALKDVDYRGTYADGVEYLKATIQRQAALIERYREAMVANVVGTSGRTPMTHEAIAAIEKEAAHDQPKS